jgi:hypothetical protein
VRWFSIDWFGGVKVECPECHHYKVEWTEQEARNTMCHPTYLNCDTCLVERYLTLSQRFIDGENIDFSWLFRLMMRYTNTSDREMAKKCEFIPSSIKRWREGNATPLEGVQKVVIGFLREKILERIETE